ncbi:ATP-binding protein [Pedobacter paludis]|uniref:histidine kinase n=1 Tax=Pedobacter paludis TaxID=2203212 RepID=A0A317EZW5_9SPHI|nr:ATP-binding protein [Pedobacter paludis]
MACQEKKLNNLTIKDLDFEKAKSLMYKDNDSAFFHFNKVATNSVDSLMVAQAYTFMATIQTESSDYFGSQESLILSLRFLNEQKTSNFDCLSSTYNELGLTNYYLKNYKIALTYFEKALYFSADDVFRLTILNNKALVYRNAGKYNEALLIYNRIISKKNANTVEYARILSNIAKTQWLQNPKYNALPKFLRALQIRVKENDEWGQNASYAHLADYYSGRVPDSALYYASKMYHVAQTLASPDDQLEALQKLIKLSSPVLAKKYFERYQNLSDSLQTVRNSEKNQYAIIRYESEKNKGDFLKAQAENIEKQKDILVKNIGLGVLGVILISAYFWHRKRKEILKNERELEVKNTELKYVKKVHDRVANKVYHVMSEVENTPHLDKEKLLDKLEVLYDISRNISYERNDIDEENFAQQLNQMLKAYSSEKVEVDIEGNHESIWTAVSSITKSEVSCILQELMTNMMKHSEANQVALHFEQKNGNININYSDNGIGISDQFQYGNGLSSTGNRIDHIRGTITFDTKAEKGLKILISFPIS